MNHKLKRKMKRYTIEPVNIDDYENDQHYMSVRQKEDKHGDWVKFTDTIRLNDELKFYKRQLARLEEQVTTMKKTIISTSDYWK